MRKIKLYPVLIIGFSLLFLLFTAAKCNRHRDCKASITVLDSLGTVPQVGVNVKLYATVTTSSGGTTTADLKAEGVTDSNGKVFFTFKLPAIMDIKADKPNCVSAIGKWCTGKGIIKLEEGKTTEKIVYLKQ